LGGIIALLVFVIICVYIWGQRRAGYPAFIKFSKWLKKQFKRPKPSIPRDVEGRGTLEADASSEKNLIVKGLESQGFRQIKFPPPASTRDAEMRNPHSHTRKLKPALGSSSSSSKQGIPKSQRNVLCNNVDGLGGISPEAVRRDSEDYDTSTASNFVSTEAPRIPTPGFEQALRNSYVQNTSTAENPGDKRRSGSFWFGQNQA
jgi:hypothetical protein